MMQYDSLAEPQSPLIPINRLENAKSLKANWATDIRNHQEIMHRYDSLRNLLYFLSKNH